MIHSIRMPDGLNGRELREIVWDDVAGTVSGDHGAVPRIQQLLDKPAPLDFSGDGQKLVLKDPAHDPADFLRVLRFHWWRPFELPASLRGVEPTRGVFMPLPPGAKD